MQSHKLILNRFFTASTQSVSSNLELINNYFLHTQGIGGGIVDETNVRGFLNDDRNQIVITDFFSFLTASTTIEEFREIFYSDNKLADLFNSYYQTSILRGVSTPISTINSELVNTSAVTTFNTNFNWDGISPLKYLSGITLDIIDSTRTLLPFQKLETFTSEESYYIPVFIPHDSKQISRNIFEICPKKIISLTGETQTGPTSGDVVNSIVQCFVDLNLNTNINNYWYTPIGAVSFTSSTYSVNEGNILRVGVSLSNPSSLGLEEVNVDINNVTTSASDFGFFTSSIGLSWSAGEQHKEISFDLIDDLLLEGTETFKLNLSNFTSVLPGVITAATASVIDTTILRGIRINTLGGAIIPIPLSPGILLFSIREGEDKDITISLDGPSIHNEEVDFLIVNGTAGVSDYAPTASTIHLTWSAGEIDKVINFSAFTDNLIFEGIESFSVNLASPINSVLNGFSQAGVIIEDVSNDIQFVRINIPAMYIQAAKTFGGSLNSELRYMIDTTYNNPFDANNHNKRLLKFGISNPPIGPDGSGPNTTTAIYFGSPQTRYFLGTESDVRLFITNDGVFPMVYNSVEILPGQSFSATVTTSDFDIDLPSNDGLVLAATLSVSADTLTLAKYKIELEVDYSQLDFILKDNNNLPSTNKRINLGSHVFNTFAGPINIQNGRYRLLTTYTDFVTGRDTPFTTPVCPANTGAPTFSGPAFAEYSAFVGMAEDVTIDGIALIDAESQTSFSGFTFSPNNGGIITTCGLGYTETTTATSEPTYTTIPFHVEI